MFHVWQIRQDGSVIGSSRAGVGCMMLIGEQIEQMRGYLGGWIKEGNVSRSIQRRRDMPARLNVWYSGVKGQAEKV